MPDTASTYSESFSVRSYEADATGIATPAAICNYLQEVAGNHAFTLNLSVEQLRDRNVTWVLSRLRVEMSRLPAWRDELQIQTWPAGAMGVFALREFIVRSDDDEMGRATSAWILLDLERRRPMRLTEEILALRSGPAEHALPPPQDRLPGLPEAAERSERLRVRWSDMDVNEHTNNVRYVAWAMDALPEEVVRAGEITSLAVDFLSETRMNDELDILTARLPGSDATYLTEIRLSANETPVARVQSRWRSALPG